MAQLRIISYFLFLILLSSKLMPSAQAQCDSTTFKEAIANHHYLAIWAGKKAMWGLKKFIIRDESLNDDFYNKKKLNVSLSFEYGQSALTYGSLRKGGIQIGSNWKPSIGFKSNVRYNFTTGMFKEFFTETGISYSRYKGLYILGKSIKGAQFDTFENLGRYTNNVIGLPVSIGRYLNSNNSRIYFSLGIEWCKIPAALNTYTPRNYLQFEGKRNNTDIGTNFIAQTGFRLFANEKRPIDFGLFYREYRREMLGNRPRFIGGVINFYIL